jgi:spore coat protein CotH
MYGHTALQLPKKNLKVNFRGKYGEDVLSYPVFGEDGPAIFDSLCLRAGQDNPQAIIRDELFSSLCADYSDHVLIQKSRYCIVYVNGNYYGIYALKEAFGEVYYSQNMGVSEASVTVVQAPVQYRSEIFSLMSFCASKDMTDPANYDYLSQHIDMDSLVDWMIIQGYSANGDVQQNLRYFRSTENGNRWQYALYDLDWAFYFHVPFANMFSDTVWQHKMMTKNIIKSPQFREKFLKRLSELMETTLSTENVVNRINELEAVLDPEVRRDRARWGYNYNGWKKEIQRMRSFIENFDYTGEIVNRMRKYLNMTNAEVEEYFGRWV